MSIRMTLACPEFTDEDLQDLVDELSAELNQLDDLEAKAEEVSAPRGSRGDIVSIGSMLLTFMSSGAAVAAFGVLKTYFEREPKLKVRLKGPDGEEVEIDAARMNAAQTDRALEILEKSIGQRKKK